MIWNGDVGSVGRIDGVMVELRSSSRTWPFMLRIVRRSARTPSPERVDVQLFQLLRRIVPVASVQIELLRRPTK